MKGHGEEEGEESSNEGQFQRRPKPKHPAAIAYEKKMAEIDARITTVKRKMEVLRGGYSGNAGADPNASATVRAEREKLLHRMREIRDQQRKISEDRKVIAKEYSDARELLRKKGAEVSSQRDKLPYKSVADIDRMIAEYEKQLETKCLQVGRGASNLARSQQVAQGKEGPPIPRWKWIGCGEPASTHGCTEGQVTGAG